MVAHHGRYIGINYAHSRNELFGCINDARDWLKEHQAFLTTGELLLEQQATKAGIFRFVRPALDLLKPDDWLILQLSGHGSSQPDITKIEPSGRNQLFCPYDLDKHVILDDEWFALLSQRDPLSNVLFITDCCFSGTMARGIRKQRTRPRFIPFQQLAQGMAPHHRERLYAATPRTAADGIADGVVHLSGCADDQVSYDAMFNNRSNGALTHYALESWRRLRPGAKLMDWYRGIRENLPSPAGSKQKFDQRPQLNCAGEWWDRFVPGFELDEPTPPPAPPAIADKPPTAHFVVNDWETTEIKWRKRAA